MALIDVIIAPAGAHPTASVTSKILNSGAATTSTSGFKVGSLNTGDTGYLLYTSIFGNMPEKEDIYGAGVTDSNLAIKGLKLQFTVTTASADDWYVFSTLKNGTTTNFPTARVVYNGPDYDNSDTRGWWSSAAVYGDIIHTDYAAIENPPVGYFRPDATGAYTVDLQDYVDSASLDWGDKFHIMVRKEAHTDEIMFFQADGSTPRTSNTYVDLLLTYEDPEPSMPVIKLEADTDYRSSVVTMTTKPSDKDIVSYLTRWKDGGYDTFENRIGVYYNTSGSEEVLHTGGTPFATGIFKEVDGDIASGFLDTEGETDYLAVWASDMSASGNDASVVNRTMSNSVSHSRMSCEGSLSAGTAIGEELTLTVSGYSDAGTVSAKAFTKFGVNWDGESTATDDSINDYTIVTMDASATTATVKHTFHKGGTYKVNVCVIDDKGFRSDFTQAASRSIVSTNPVALLRASRDTAVRAKYGDEFSVVNLSASHSYAVGSDKMIFAHRFQHDSDTPVTTYPMENDNSNFNDVTTTVKLKCNTVNCAGTVLKVYGKVSVSSDGTPNVDNDGSFDHYEYQVHSVSPSDTIETYGTVAQTTAPESVLFKSVDFVVVSTLDPQDATAGAVYTLADGDGNIINNKIRAAKDTDKWGGYHKTEVIQVDFINSSSTIHYDSGLTTSSFLKEGFVPGDTIYVDAAVADAANNNFFTVASVTATDIVVNETITDETNDAGVRIYRVNGPTLPIASYDVNTPTITCSVRQALAESATSQNLASSSDVTQALRFVSEEYNTLDFDTQADAGHIAIQSANIKRSGGLNSLMSLGGKAYPTGTTRTKMGTPNVSLSVRALTQTGYRQIWNLIEGGRYEWATIDSKKVDVPGTAYKQLRMRLSDGSIAKDPSMASQYMASLNFVVIGELVT
tara:strand:+ start:1635 stop:4352 length:2718 start_codon:yes stop_codon:yes gene_type:complete